ncbi:hypothetical protein [Bacillus cereus]|uniref:Uncharacterized protein n=1 Tax=Bacillus cereus TaxID=1396 RepID=A0AA44Q6K3_BACCE|nr:hypothetical protein [Bacillus cereus]PFN00488.1 hypothetical protein COJ55_25080 [Bacillus cereus]PFR90757.1 hypothetical protein COK38_23335 [Bacillus cereus]
MNVGRAQHQVSIDTEIDIQNAILSYDSTERIAYFFILGGILFWGTMNFLVLMYCIKNQYANTE